jgi:hypothetical protein
VKLKLLPKRGRKRRPREQAPKAIVPRAADPFDAARARLKHQIPPRHD